MTGFATQPKLTVYSNLICPFDHRSRVALHAKGLEYEFVQIPLSVELAKMKDEGVDSCINWKNSGKTIDELVSLKESYKVNYNPGGEVPTLVIDDRNIVRESDVVVEFLDDMFPERGAKLLPSDPYQRANSRNMMKIIGRNNGISLLYKALNNRDCTKDEELRDSLYKFFAKFCDLADDTGPYFLGENLSIVDIMLGPFYIRFLEVLFYFRGIDLVPTDEKLYPWATRMRSWGSAITGNKSFQDTMSTREHYIEAYGAKAYAWKKRKFCQPFPDEEN